VDNDGTNYAKVASMLVDTWYLIGTGTSNCNFSCGTSVTTDSVCVDLSGMGSNYLAKVPTDPKTGSDLATHYGLKIDSNGAITVRACDAEGEGPGGSGAKPLIEITR